MVTNIEYSVSTPARQTHEISDVTLARITDTHTSPLGHKAT